VTTHGVHWTFLTHTQAMEDDKPWQRPSYAVTEA